MHHELSTFFTFHFPLFAFICTFAVIMSYEEFWKPLTALYDVNEAKAIARMVFDVQYGLTMADIIMGKVDALDHQQLQATQQRLLQAEPVQYVIGMAEFGGLQFHVEPGVLIPRPETYELCQRVVEKGGTSILDIGTGSGCIACTLAVELPTAEVVAWDISDEALRIASSNAQRLGAKVRFEQHDILCPPDDHQRWDAIVSNPPYICQCEQQQMQRHVLDYEPSLALFVPDDDPLLFYRAIGRYAAQALKPGGYLLVEINMRYGEAVGNLLTDMGFADSTVYQDQFGKDRFVYANKV